PPDGAGLGVVGARHPAAAAAGAPGIVAPALHRLVGAGDGEELPFLRAGRRIDAEYRAAAGPFPALRADYHDALGIERRTREADRQLLGIDQLGGPGRLAGLHVERDEPPVHRADEYLA